jgi:hypothetical protein
MMRTVLAMCGVTALTTLSEFGGPAQASAQKTCSMKLEQRADDSLINAAGNWPSLLKHQRTFASCDDGALAEGYSDAVVTLFANQWDQFGVFVALSERHPDFRRWAIRHIDATASDDDLNKIVVNAAKCVRDVKAKILCKAIGRAAVDALTELKQAQQE